MKKVKFSDSKNKIHVKEVSPKNFIFPSKDDLVRIDGVSYKVEGIIHNYDKQEIMIVIYPKSED